MFFEKGHGIAIGTEMSGGVSDVVIENIRANGKKENANAILCYILLYYRWVGYVLQNIQHI